MSFNKVVIGGKSFPPEWFDLDRSEKQMRDPQFKPVPYEEILQKSVDEKWKFTPDKCPECESGALSYGEDDDSGDHRDGYTFVSCSYCFKGWWRDDHGSRYIAPA